MSWLSVVTLALAILGAGLGVLNTWRAFSMDRIRIRLRLRWSTIDQYWQVGHGGDPLLMVEAVNLSTFPIWISKAGFMMRKGDALEAFKETRALSLPVRIEPRASTTIPLDPTCLESHDAGSLEGVWVATACGFRAKLTEPTLAARLNDHADFY